MAEQREVVILDAQDKSAAATASANKNLESVEKKAQQAGAAVTGATEKFGTQIVSITDRTQKQIDRVVAQAEARLLSLKSPLERLEAQKSGALNKVAGDPAAVQKVTAAYNKLIEAETSHGSLLQKVSSGIKQFIEDPAGAAAEQLDGLGESFGAAGLAAGAAAGAFVAVGVATYELIESSGKAAEQLQNMSERLGLNLEDTQLLADTARIAGVNMDAFAGVSRKLSETLASGGAAQDAAVRGFERIGVSVVDQSGHFRSSLDILRDLSTALDRLPDHASQVKVLSDVLGRSAVELLPQIKNFKDLEEQARSIGPALDSGVISPLTRADDALDRLGIMWDRTKARLAAKIVAAIDFVSNNKAALNGFLMGFGGPVALGLAAHFESSGEAAKTAIKETSSVAQAANAVQLADVARGNALVDQFRNRPTAANLQSQISALETERNEISARIQKGAGESVQRAAIIAFDSVAARIERLKLQLKDVEEVPNKEKEAHKALLSAQAEEASGFAKIEIQRKNEIEQLGVTKKAIADLNAQAAVRIKLEERSADLAHANAQNSADLARIRAAQQRAELDLEPKTAADVDQRGAIDARRAALDVDFQKKILNNAIERINAQSGFEKDKLLEVLNARLIDEATYAKERSNIERKAQDEIDAARIQASAAADQAVLAARVRVTTETVVRTRELQRSNEEEARQIALAGLEIDKQAQLQSLEGIQAVTIDAQIALNARRASLEAEFERRAEIIREESEKAKTKLELDQLEVLHSAGLIADQVYEEARLAIATGSEERIAAMREGSNAAVLKAQVDASIKASELIRQHNQDVFDSYKTGVRRVLDETLDSGTNFFVAVGREIKSAFENAFKEAIASRAAAVLTEITTGTKVTLEQEGANKGPLGRIMSALGLGGSKPVFGHKLEAPGHLGDVALVNGAVPVFVTGGSPTAQNQAATRAQGGSGGLGGLLSGLGGLAGLASAAGPGGGTVAAVGEKISFPDIEGSGTQDLGTVFSRAGATPPTFPSQTGGGGIGNLPFFSGLKKQLSDLGGIGGKFSAAHGGVNGALGGGLLAGGGILAMDGLRRGGIGGLLETTAGGAAIGFKFGGPIGALIGGAVGAAAGFVRLFIHGKDEQIVSKVKQVYGVDISRSFAKNPLQQIIDQSFGGDVDVGIRSPQVRDLISLYAQSTGQRAPLADKPYGVGLSISRGGLQQTAALVDGAAIAYGGGTAKLAGPVDQLIVGRTAPGPNMPSSLIVQSLSLSLNGESAAKALTGQIVQSPDAVGQASMRAAQQGTTRRQLAALQTAPGTLLS